MNKVLPIFLFLVIVSCIGKHNSKAQRATIKNKPTGIHNLPGDTLLVDLNDSEILWKGTKMRGTGKHEGKIQLQDAYLLTKENQLIGGSFSVNMNTIEVTDIPDHEPIPRRRLTDHLKSVDFFNSEEYPVSYFKISNVKLLKADSVKVSGNLTIKNITHAITFIAGYRDKIFSTSFLVDRFKWKIAYQGNWADKTFVDKDIELTIKLKTE